MTIWANNCEWFQESWLYQQPNGAASRKKKGKKKTKDMLKVTIESKCKSRLKKQKKLMQNFVDAVENSTQQDIVKWSQENFRGLKLSMKQLNAWKEKGFEMEGIMGLITGQTVDLQQQLQLSHGRWQALLSMHDQIIRGDVKFAAAVDSDGVFHSP